jgi:hypothetical protein
MKKSSRSKGPSNNGSFISNFKADNYCKGIICQSPNISVMKEFNTEMLKINIFVLYLSYYSSGVLITISFLAGLKAILQ